MKRHELALTQSEPFFEIGGRELFTMNPGLPIEDALEHAANLLGCVEDLAMNIGAETAQEAEISAIQYLAEMDKALVNAAGARGARGGQ